MIDSPSMLPSVFSIKESLKEIIENKYQQFIIQKETILTMAKDHHKRLLSQLDEFRFTTLDKYLATRYSSCKKQGYTCELCGTFNVGTLKGLAAHKRGCARKQIANGGSSETLALKNDIDFNKSERPDL